MDFRRQKIVSGSKTLTIALLIAFHGDIGAIEATGAVGTGIEYSDNIRESAFNTESDFTQVTYGEVGFEEVRKRFKADANLRLENEHYYQNTYDDETSLTSGFGLFTIDLIDEFLEWQATFSRTDVVADSAEDENPDTREFRNIFRTGPTVNYAISRTTNFRLRGSYVKVDNSEDTATDSERAEGSAALSHQLNRLTSFNLSGNYSEVIDSDDEEEIENSRITLGISRSYVDGALSLSYGQQRVESNLADTEKGTFVDVILTRDAFLAHNFIFSFNQSISDTSIGFEGDEEGNQFEVDPTQATSQTDIETRDRANLTMMRDAESFIYDLGLIYEESEFKIREDVERYRGAIIGFSPKLYARLTPRFQYSYARESFGLKRGIGEDVTHTITASLSYQLVRDLFLNSFITFETRSNSTLVSREHDEFSTGLGVRWEFL